VAIFLPGGRRGRGRLGGGGLEQGAEENGGQEDFSDFHLGSS